MNSLSRFGVSLFAGLALVSSALAVGLNQVTYTPTSYPVEGTIPFTRSVTVGMEIQRGVAPFNPVALSAPVTVSIAPITDASGNIVGVATPAGGGVSISTALSYLQPSPLPQVTFTATNTKVFITFQITVPADAVGGEYGYTLKTTGWPAGMSGGVPTDVKGFSINASVTVPTNPNPPTVVIQSPTPSQVFTYAPSAMPATIPLSFTASSTGGSPIYSISADLDGVSTFRESLNSSGVPVITATDPAPVVSGFNTTSVGVTTNMTVSTAGAHSANVTATNSVGSNQPAQSVPFSVYVTPITPSAVVPAFVVGQPVSFQIAISPLTYPAATYSIGSGSLPAGVTLDPTTGIVSGTPTAVGSAAPVVITATNYFPGSTTNVVGTASQSYTIPVSKGTPTITWSNPAAITYGTPLSATQLNATASITGGTFAYTPALAAILPAGPNTLSVTFNPTDSTNYNSVTKTVSIVVNRKPLVASATVSDKEYDGTTLAAFTATGYPKLAGVVGADDVGLAPGSTAAFSNKVVGTGKTVIASGLALTGASLGNYSVPSSVTTTASITTKRLTVSGVTANDRDYDGTTGATLNMSAAQLVGVIPNDNVLLAGTGAGLFADKNAGSNKAVTVSALGLSGSDAGNYLLIQPSGVTASIRQVPLLISAISQIINFGTTPAGFSASYSGFVAGESQTTAGVLLTPVTYTAAPTIGNPVQAGTYVITPGGATATNYSITFKTGTLTVTKVTLTITADNKTMTSGSALPSFTATASGLVNGDTVAVVGALSYSTAANTAVAGTYPITVSGSLTPSNYTVTYTPGTLTVTAQQTCPASVLWLPPISLGKVQQGGSVLPIKFLLQECCATTNDDDDDCDHEGRDDDRGWGNSHGWNDRDESWDDHGGRGTDYSGLSVACHHDRNGKSTDNRNCRFDSDHDDQDRDGCVNLRDKTVVISIYEVGSNKPATQYKYGTGSPNPPDYAIDGDYQYQLNFTTAKGKHVYHIDVYRFPPGTTAPRLVGSKEFTTK